MINPKLVKNVMLGGVVVGSLALASFQASAKSIEQSNADNAHLMTSSQFYSLLEKTKPNQVASNFGTPDHIVSMRNSAGEVTGVVWVYRAAVLNDQAKLDANFMVVNGEFIYVSLTKAS